MPRLFTRMNSVPVIAYPGTAYGHDWFVMLPNPHPFTDETKRVHSLQEAEEVTRPIIPADLNAEHIHLLCGCGSGECICECTH